MFCRVVVGGCEKVAVHFVPGHCLECQRGDKLQRMLCDDTFDLGTFLDQQTHQHRCLVGSDTATDANYYLLACIIEQVSGMSYYEYIQKNIFDRCGMNHSNLEFQKTDTRGYDYKDRYYSIPSALALGCGDVNSNVTDLFKWNVLFTSGKVVKKKVFKKMIDSESYGYGVYCHDDSIFHAGVTNVFNSYDGYYFDGKLSIIVLSNCPVAKVNTTTVGRNIY